MKESGGNWQSTNKLQPSLSSSTDSNTRWNYDVFLSFRGKDTRKNFTDHLYHALVREGIRTFRDDDEIDGGGEIGPSCLKAIEESRFSIVIFSEGYASSSWCLEELAHIVKCRKSLGHVVWPIFYDVNPTHVENLSEKFGEAFEENHKNQSEDTLKEWRDAVKEVAYLKDLDLPNHANGHEAENIENIIREISRKLSRTKLHVAIHPVGLKSHANTVLSLIGNEAKDVRIIAIYGMAGIGKTTIAKEVYNEIFNRFEGTSFLENVKQKFDLVRQKIDLKGITRLQRQLLSDTLKRKHEKIHNVNGGLNLIRERLCRKKVLIVLDDVDRMDHINKILGNYDWLYPGSRVVITTRVKDMLQPCELCRQYEVNEMDDNHSLQLLSFYAFGKSDPPNGYLDCAKRLVKYAGGLPLALEVLGASLNGEIIDVWNRRLKKLKVISHEDIHSKLKISYDALDDTEKSLFLDITCFFTGKNKDYVTSILDDLDIFATEGILSLLKRCLVKIDCHNKLLMHDLVRDMGREIVRRESPKYPGKRSRLWRYEDVTDVLTSETGTDIVEGLTVNLSKSEHASSTETFKEMKSLRLLQLNHACLLGSYEHISKRLRWLCWHNFPSKFIPKELYLRNLIALDLRYSSLKQFSENIKLLKKLKFLNLSHSYELISTPNFEGFSCLEKLILKDCTSLVEVHESIGCLSQLLFLNLKDCKNLKSLPKSICGLGLLEKLHISGCSKLEELPVDLGNLKSLVELIADGTAISTVPESIGYLNELKCLSLRECHLISLRRKSVYTINFLPTSLKKLDMRNCRISDDIVHIDVQGLLFLEELKLCGNNFTRLPIGIGSLPKLHTVWLNGCKRLKSIPHLHSGLKSLRANNCSSLESIKLANFRWEPALEVRGCASLKEVEGFLNMEKVDVEKLEMLLKINGSFTQQSLENIEVYMINNLTETYKICPLQALCENGIYSIFLPRCSIIPYWFDYQTEDNAVCFHVPQLHQGTKIIGIATCAIYAWKSSEACFFSPHIALVNKTKKFHWAYSPYITFFSRTVEEDIMWLCYWMFDEQLEGNYDFDTNWRFKDEMDEGDEVEFTVDMGFGITTKKCGAHLLYVQPVDEGCSRSSQDIAIVSDASSRNHRRFSRSRAKWLTKDYGRFSKSRGEWLATRHQMITPHDRYTWRPTDNALFLFHRPAEAGNEDINYLQWSKQREQAMNKIYHASSTERKSSKSRFSQTNTLKSKSNEKLAESKVKNGSTLVAREISSISIEPKLLENTVPMKENIVKHTAEQTSTIKSQDHVQQGNCIASSSEQPEAMMVPQPLSLPTTNLSGCIVPLRMANPLESPSASNATPPTGSTPQASSSNVHAKSKNLLAQLAARSKTMPSPTSVSNSTTALNSDSLQQHRKSLAVFLDMSVEAIHKGDAFVKIKRIALAIAENTNDHVEKATLEDLISRLAEFRDSIPSSMAMAEAARARRESLQERKKEIDDKLYRMQDVLGSLEAEFSRLSEEEMQVESEIQCLMVKREQLLFMKNSVAQELDKTSEETSKDLEEWGELEMETKKADDDWVQANQMLGHANSLWKLTKEKLKF